MHLSKPKKSKHKAADTEPEHTYDHLPESEIPALFAEVAGNGCHEIQVANNRQREKCHDKNGAIPGHTWMEQHEPGGLCSDHSGRPKPPSSKRWSFWSEAQSAFDSPVRDKPLCVQLRNIPMLANVAWLLIVTRRNERFEDLC